MARSKKADASGAGKKPAAAAGGDTADAKNEMTDDQRQALFFSHKRAYEVALAKKKAADAAFRTTCKLAKAELGDDAVASIKDAMLLETDEGEAKLRAQAERILRIARWMNTPFGQQADMFTDFTDPRPATERARSEGKKAGMEGLACRSPYAPTLPQNDEWIEGWREGQKAIFAIQKGKDGALFSETEKTEDERRRDLAAQKPDFADGDGAEAH